jgi:hypothetical protein
VQRSKSELAYVRFGSISTFLAEATRPFMSAMPPIATKPVGRNETSRCANSRPEQVQQRAWRLTTLFVLLARADEGSSSRSCGKPFEDSPRRAIG